MPALLLLAALSSCAFLDPSTYGLGPAGEGALRNGEQQGEWTYRDANGAVVATRTFVDDQPEGLQTENYPSGARKLQYTISQGKREGLFQSWHPSGALQSKGWFVDGLKFGEWRIWHPSGALREQGSFRSGMKEGRWTLYGDDGREIRSGIYVEQEPVGEHRLVGADEGEKVVWKDMPEGVEWLEERWQDGGELRRTGFMRDGAPTGLWTTYGRDGSLRTIGEFEGGLPSGTWMAFGPTGELLAIGPAGRGGAEDRWRVLAGDGFGTRDAAAFGSDVRFDDEWSDRSIHSTEPVGVIVNTWIAEARSPLDFENVARQSPPSTETELTTADRALLEEGREDPDIPVPTELFTVRVRDAFDTFVDWYGGVQRRIPTGIYGDSWSGQAEEESLIPEPGGQKDVASGFIGNPLPMTTFRDADGNRIDLKRRTRGRIAVVVILRGFGDGICPYCVAQTKAMCREGALAALEERNALLQVVYPGSENGFEAFQTAYRDLTAEEIPYAMLYENAAKVGIRFDIQGTLVVPTTLVVDESGVVRFAYVGKNEYDRPPLPLLLEEIDRIRG
ncbi:MAG: redoxin domain-containing protein [Planctomycetota bacterium]